MCGLQFLIQCRKHNDTFDIVETFRNALQHCSTRGPDDTTIIHKNVHNNKMMSCLGFHRLAINGLDQGSNQPLQVRLGEKNYTLICNGEIYNYQELQYTFGFDYQTHNDCEAIIHLYNELCILREYDISYFLNMLDGVFAFVLYEESDYSKDINIIIARDRIGVRPLFEGKIRHTHSSTNDATMLSLYSVGSTLKNMTHLNEAQHDTTMLISQFPPGHYKRLQVNVMRDMDSDKDDNTHNCSIQIKETKQYYSVDSIVTHDFELQHENEKNSHTDTETHKDKQTIDMELSHYLPLIRRSLIQAVEKRIHNTDRPIACLLSGGLDSSLITSIVCMLMREKYGIDVVIETYSIGIKGSEDLKYAKLVADHLQTHHTEICVSEEEFLNAIPETVRNIESYDTTTVRASVGNYLVSKYIAEHSPSNAKVIFNGDGSDEIAGGYLYFYKSPNTVLFDAECRRLLKQIHYFDVLRSDRSIASNGLEARTPFLDSTFIHTYLSIPASLRKPCFKNEVCEKYALRKAFDVKQHGPQYLPDAVLWRRKEAFSDGVSSQARSWKDVIEERIIELNEFKENKERIYEIHTSLNITLEQSFYKCLFELNFGKYCEHIIPDYWMPRFVNATDSSARTLDIY